MVLRIRSYIRDRPRDLLLASVPRLGAAVGAQIEIQLPACWRHERIRWSLPSFRSSALIQTELRRAILMTPGKRNTDATTTMVAPVGSVATQLT